MWMTKEKFIIVFFFVCLFCLFGFFFGGGGRENLNWIANVWGLMSLNMHVSQIQVIYDFF